MICSYVLVLVIFAFNARLLWRLWSDEVFLREYVEMSPKAWLWRKMLGPERAAALTRGVFVPLGALLWGALGLGAVIWALSEP